MLLAREESELRCRLRRAELSGFFVPVSRHGDVRHDATNAEPLQNRRIVGSGKHHRRTPVSGLGRPPQHQPSRGNITASNQGIRSLERRSDLTGVKVMNGISGCRALGGRCGWRSTALQCTLIGRLDVLGGR